MSVRRMLGVPFACRGVGKSRRSLPLVNVTWRPHDPVIGEAAVTTMHRMIELQRTTTTHLDVVGSGTVDRDDVRQAADTLATALEAAEQAGGHVTLVLDLRSVDDLSLRAFSLDAALGARLSSRLTRLDRVALIGDDEWLEPLVRLQASAAPALAVRRFGTSDVDAARHWATHGATAPSGGAGGAPATSVTNGADPLQEAFDEGATVLKGLFGSVLGTLESQPVDAARSERSAGGAGLRLDERDGVLELDLDGRIERADVERVAAVLAQLQTDGALLLARIARFDGIDPAALLSPALWQLQGAGLTRVKRVAVVTSIGWLGRSAESLAQRQRVEVRSFAAGEEAAARDWLREGTTVA